MIINSISRQKMKLHYLTIVIFFLLLACADEEDKSISELEELIHEPHIARVIEKFQDKEHTYLQVTESKETYWIAVPSLKIEIGETVYFSRFVERTDFKGENVDQTFDNILFVADARKSATPDEMKNINSVAASVKKQDVVVEQLTDGKTIQQIFMQRSELSGEIIKVRGKVVKYNEHVLQRNWIHIQDGTGTVSDYDLVITSSDKVQVGDIIIAEGKLSNDKDFGAGSFFEVIVEDAKIIRE